MTTVYLAKTDFLNDENTYLRYLSKVDTYRRERIERYKDKKDKCLSLCAGVLINIGLDESGKENAVYKIGENGKPYFLGTEDLHFNLSHSESAVIVAFSDKEIGCDIERIKPADTGVAKRFFSEPENKMLEKTAGKEKDRLFYRIWTVKESFLKMTGKGITFPLSKVSADFNGKTTVTVDGETHDCEFYEFTFEDYKCCLCVKGGIDKVEIKKIFV